MTILIGLTGSISTGKSTVGALLRENLANDKILKHYIDCDKITHELLKTHNEHFIRALERILHEEHMEIDVHSDMVLDKEGYIDRPKLGAIIFKNPEVRKKWNRETHGMIFKEITAQIWRHYSWKQWLPWHGGKQDVILVDMPLLFETPHVRKFMKKVICVSIHQEEVQMERLLKRNPEMTREEAHQRIRTQMPTAEKERLSDYVIANDSDLEELQEKVDTVYQALKKDLHLG